MSKLPTKISLKLDPEKYPGDSLEEKGAAIAVDPSMKAALTAHLYTTNLGKIDALALVDRMQELTDEASSGNMSHFESMLASQAIALDAIFHRLASQANQNIGRYAGATDTYLRLGLKAQAQSRSAIEALAALKAPRQYISQTNVASTMQVNNSLKGLEARYGERMDFGAQAASGSADSTVEALGEVYGSQDTRRESRLQQEFAETRDVFS
jgi:hypothetical protein